MLVSVDQTVVGVYTGKGKNQTFTETSSFTGGDTIVFRATVLDGNGVPVSNAKVTFTVTGPENITITSGPSDASGLAEASWSTSAPNKRGQGGTTLGSYEVVVSDVVASGYLWDGNAIPQAFTIQ
ncbi:MAG: Ig-like domain-containing protein [Anaerolineales bacterium]